MIAVNNMDTAIYHGLMLTHNVWEPFINRKVIWTAYLDNGLCVAQDDGRPGVHPWRAWDRLRMYLAIEKNVSIIDFYVRIMDNVVQPLPKNAEGYFYREAHGAIAGDAKSIDMFTIGYVKDGKVYDFKYRKPELTLFGNPQVRDVSEVIDSVWLNPKKE